MTTQKRRVIYLSDEEWQEVRERAQGIGLTMSAYIRSSLTGGHVTPLSMQKELRERAAESLIPPLQPYSTRPFTPVPKKRV